MAIKGVDVSEEKRNSLAGVNAEEKSMSTIEVGFDAVDDMNMWLKTLESQISKCCE